MGRGNCCVSGQYEGLFYIDNDDLLVFRKDDDLLTLREIDYSERSEWTWDEFETEILKVEVFSRLKHSILRRFASFSVCDKWIRTGADRYDRHAILENRLFYICLEDNEWSVGVELVQKEDIWGGGSLSGLQKRHCQRYLGGIKDALFEQFGEIEIYTGARTSGRLRR